MIIELPDINKFKQDSFPGKWKKVSEGQWGPVDVGLGIIPEGVGEFHGELKKLVKKANELLLNEQNKSVKELKEGRDEILTEYNRARGGYPGFEFNRMKEISDKVKEQIENELDAVIEQNSAANIEAARDNLLKQLKEKNQADKKELAAATELKKQKIKLILKKYDNIEDSIRQQITSDDKFPSPAHTLLEYSLPDIDTIISELKLYPPKLVKEMGAKNVEGKLETLKKYIAKAEAKAEAEAEGDKFTGESLLDVIGDDGGKHLPGGVKVELEKLEALEKVSGSQFGMVKPEEPVDPKTAITSKCPCYSIKGGGKNKRKKNTKKKSKKYNKNKRKKYSKKKSKKSTKKKSNKKKKSNNKSTKRKNVRNR